MADSVLRLDAVGKAYGSRRVLQDVSLAVAPGERVALLGHNGAGKTTLMKLALGLVRADGGTVSVGGAAAGSPAARAAAAYLPEAPAFHPALTGREQLGLFASLAGVPRASAPALLGRVGLAGAADRRIGTWSKGMRQRLGLAQVLLGRPAVALLDEPTSGLDPVSRRELYAIIDELAGEGAAVLIASHALTELEARTDRIAILREGRMAACDRLGRLREAAGLPVRLRVTAAGERASDIQARLGGERLNGASVEILCPPSEKMARLAEVAALGALVADLDVVQPDLDDIYRHYSEGAGP